jgi:hypothetical protein
MLHDALQQVVLPPSAIHHWAIVVDDREDYKMTIGCCEISCQRTDASLSG